MSPATSEASARGMEAGPGLSLFQGSESIQLNAVTQGLEEDEEQEDKRRLNEEVTPLVSSNGDVIVGDARETVLSAGGV